MAAVKRGVRGGARPGAGRPRGSGGPTGAVRRNRVTVMLTNDELRKLKALAREKDLALGTAAYEFVAKGLARRK